jgi:PPK2 family polyphosphate:nucleotide phosphotransferase
MKKESPVHHRHLIAPGTEVSLSGIETDGKSLDERKSAEKEFEKLRDELADWQVKLYAEQKQKLLIVFQALDAGGKDGTIRKVFTGVNPQGVYVHSFKAPSARELAHDFLWRIHQAVPAKGMIGIFNRSHYEDVLVVRVDKLAPEEVWRARYDQINRFEQYLTETGTRILKFYLHISKEEQRKRFQDRIDDPDEHWKFAPEDLKKRTQWDDYRAAFEEVLTRCSTDIAPWHVIPGDCKWYRNIAVIRVIIDTLRSMNPRFPAAHSEWMNLKVEE